MPREEPQLYDEVAKMFLPDRYVEGTCPVCSNPNARGDQCENCGTYLNQTELINPRSKVTGSIPVVRPAKHWYFALSRFQKELEKYIESHRNDWKENVLQAARSWLKSGLQDRPITRDLTWGVPVPLPDAEGKVLYVWFDAPIGYISATKEAVSDESWRKWWQDDSTQWITFLGKDNIVFHTILFPAMLLAYNKATDKLPLPLREGGVRGHYILPENVPANEWMNLEGQKFSKSRGFTVELQAIVERYPADVIRYAFATMLPEQKDSDFQWKEFQARANNELADIFGNFANRVLTFASKHFENKIMGNRKELDPEGQALLDGFGVRAKEIAGMYERFRLRDATAATMDLARSANKYFNDAAPWKLIKDDSAHAAQVIRSCLEAVRGLAVYFASITPNASEKLLKTLGVNATEENWSNAHEPKLHGQTELGPIEILFPKIEDETVTEEIKRLETMAASNRDLQVTEAKQSAPQTPSAKADGYISIDDFKKIKLRTAKILEAERVPKSKKLIKLQIVLGEEKRQIVAGIGEKFTPEELIGKTIVVVANLQPAKLMGQESNGMLLAVNDESGAVSLITSDREAASGLEVR